jgi:hypothetical protein
MHTSLRNTLIVSGLAVAATLVGRNASAGSDDFIRWESVIGIIQGNNVVGSGTGAVTGAPGPWSATAGHASVHLQSGHVEFGVRGLVLAGGNSIGTPGTVERVKGTLVCDTTGGASGGTSGIVDTPSVPLDDQGNAHFNGFVAAMPASCAADLPIAFLIRTESGRWLANGAVLR